MNNNVVVFDLDDTLYNEIDFLVSAYKEIAEVISINNDICGSDVDIFNFMYSSYLNKQNPFENVIEHFQIKNFSVTELLALYRNHFPSISLASDVKELLDYLNENSIQIGIITDGRSIQQRNKIKALNLEKYTNLIVISEEFGTEKPSVANYKYVEQEKPNSNYTYIGDNITKDFLAPNQLGWNTICLIDNGRNIHNQKVNVPDHFLPKIYIKKIKEIIDLIS